MWNHILIPCGPIGVQRNSYSMYMQGNVPTEMQPISSVIRYLVWLSNDQVEPYIILEFLVPYDIPVDGKVVTYLGGTSSELAGGTQVNGNITYVMCNSRTTAYSTINRYKYCEGFKLVGNDLIYINGSYWK